MGHLILWQNTLRYDRKWDGFIDTLWTVAWTIIMVLVMWRIMTHILPDCWL